MQQYKILIVIRRLLILAFNGRFKNKLFKTAKCKMISQNTSESHWMFRESWNKGNKVSIGCWCAMRKEKDVNCVAHLCNEPDYCPAPSRDSIAKRCINHSPCSRL